MKIVVISGSTRAGSFNTRLARLIIDLRAFDEVSVVNDLGRLPFYDADIEAVRVPAGVVALRERIAAADAVVVSTPEYNGTIPGVLANALDWLSRPHGRSVLINKPVLVLSASPSRYGGARAAEHLRLVLQRIGAEVRPTGVSVCSAHQRLGGPEVDAALAQELVAALDAGLPQAERDLARAS